MTVKFIWNSPHNRELEAVATYFCEVAVGVIPLPRSITVVVEALHGAWGATVLDPRWTDRLKLDAGLSGPEVALILSHELIHLNQVHSGRLRAVSGGGVLWCGGVYTDTADLPYEEYRRLPWEVEAYGRQEWLMAEVLANSGAKSESEQTDS